VGNRRHAGSLHWTGVEIVEPGGGGHGGKG
jgi:hypothetical protein